MRRFLFGTVATVVATTMMLGAGLTGAYFTGQVKVADNVVKAGSVALSTEPTSAALSVPSLAPGSVAERPLVVVNDGTLPVDVVVTATKTAGITAFWDVLTVRAVGPAGQLYDGTLAALRTAPVRIEPGQRVELGFGVGLPLTAGNDMAGDYAKFSLVVDAEQVR
jgi:hypothetical protein